MSFFKIRGSDILNYFFPIRCLVCEHITNQKNTICIDCNSRLKFSHCEHNLNENDLTELFSGRIKFEQAFYYLKSDENGIAKNIVHEIKYNANFRLVENIGKSIQRKIKNDFQYDFILPVPLNKKKLKQRGFNQSRKIAENIFDESKILDDLVIRKEHTASQTGFGKFKRWENMDGAFEVNQELAKNLKTGSVVLIIDDVVTTGSTIEAILSELKSEYPHLKFSILTIMKA